MTSWDTTGARAEMYWCEYIMFIRLTLACRVIRNRQVKGVIADKMGSKACKSKPTLHRLLRMLSNPTEVPILIAYAYQVALARVNSIPVKEEVFVTSLPCDISGDAGTCDHYYVTAQI